MKSIKTLEKIEQIAEKTYKKIKRQTRNKVEIIVLSDIYVGLHDLDYERLWNVTYYEVYDNLGPIVFDYE